MFMKDSINPTYEMTPGFNLSQYCYNVTFLKHVFPLVIATEKETFLFLVYLLGLFLREQKYTS